MPATSPSFFVTIATEKGSTTKRVVGEILSVGRAEDCNLSISHETMSRRHLSVVVRDGECFVEDHGSINGTFVNGSRLKAHALIRVKPDDEVELAQSGIRLLVSTEPVLRAGALPPTPDTEKTKTIKTAVKTTSLQLPPVPSPQENAQKAETVVLDAYKKSAQLLHETEIEAEKRVDEIYRRAHEMQSKTDAAYFTRLNEAYRSAEQVFQKSQGEALELLAQARSRAVEIREKAEAYVTDLRIRTEKDCEKILGEAQATARDLKEQRLIEADDIMARKESELMASAHAKMNERLAKFEDDLFQQGVRRRAEIEEGLKEAASTLAALKTQVAAAEAERSSAGAELESKKARLERLRTELTGLETLRLEMTEIERSRETVESQVKGLKDQLLNLRTKFEKDKVGLAEAAVRHLDDLKLETAQKVRQMERDLLSELQEKKDRLSKEVAFLVEKQIKETPVEEDLSFRKMETAIHQLINAQLEILAKDKSTLRRQKSLASLRRRDKAWSYAVGFLVGAALILGAQSLFHLDWTLAPIEQKIVSALEQQKMDLERRRFNPPQTPDYKATYSDNVLYTNHFTGLYLSDDFQDALLAALSPYLFRMWRVDEDKTIQLLSISTALVKALQDRRDKIHPDFVGSSIEKMKDYEREVNGKMAALLGSQVRFEAFKKFESEFYLNHRRKNAK